MIDLQKALLNPSNVFKSPEEVLNSTELSRKQKIKILHRWEYDEREIEVAEEENMQGYARNTDILDAVLKALLVLGEDTSTAPRTAPTKQGGEEEEE